MLCGGGEVCELDPLERAIATSHYCFDVVLSQLTTKCYANAILIDQQYRMYVHFE